MSTPETSPKTSKSGPEEAACCSTSEQASCCEPAAKPICCGPQKAAPGQAPSRCGCR